jgi:molybdate transport system regulatory protein
MGTRKSARKKASLRPRLRVMVGKDIALGPGRVDLLELIHETGSLRAAAERMGLSYMRAWQLVKYTSRRFREPVVEVIRGGKTGGGATLTDTGRRILKIYRQMEKQCHRSTKSSWSRIRKLLAK